MPRSTAPDEAAQAVRAATEALRQGEAGDSLMQALRAARAGKAALVHTPAGEAAFWLVPFEVGERACGFARVGLDRRVLQFSLFGAAADRASWPLASLFREAPAQCLREIEAAHPGLVLGEPMLSYDGSPARWAWRVTQAGGGGEGAAVFYVSAGGWYPRA